MSIFLRFIKLPSREKKLALETLFWVLTIRIMVWIFPFQYVQKKVQKIAKHLASDQKKISIQKIRSMIVTISKYVPRATCLVQALVGYILYTKHGYNTKIKIGVLTENGVFEAHAWLEYQGYVVLGQSEKKYKTILDIEKRP
ncbi:MAG: lasso peptide biosynthesis B2 protein [Methanobacterium sp.]